MRHIFLTTLLLGLLVFTNAETFERAKLRSLGKKMPTEALFETMKDSQFGKNLLNMLSLKFQTSQQKYESLANVLQQLEDQIKGQQTAEDQEYTSTSTSYAQTIEAQGKVITESTANIDAYTANLADAREARRQKEGDRALFIQEREQISNFLADLEETRINDRANFDTRVRNTELLVQGVDKTLAVFKGSTNNQELDQDAVQSIINLVENIRASLEASIADDSRADNEAERQYQEFTANRNTRLQVIKEAVEGLDRDIAGLQGRESELERNLESEKVRRANAEQLKQQVEESLAALTQRYEANKAVRTEQIKLIVLVRTKLNENPQEVQNVLQQA